MALTDSGCNVQLIPDCQVVSGAIFHILAMGRRRYIYGGVESLLPESFGYILTIAISQTFMAKSIYQIVRVILRKVAACIFLLFYSFYLECHYVLHVSLIRRTTISMFLFWGARPLSFIKLTNVRSSLPESYPSSPGREFHHPCPHPLNTQGQLYSEFLSLSRQMWYYIISFCFKNITFAHRS